MGPIRFTSTNNRGIFAAVAVCLFGAVAIAAYQYRDIERTTMRTDCSQLPSWVTCTPTPSTYKAPKLRLGQLPTLKQALQEGAVSHTQVVTTSVARRPKWALPVAGALALAALLAAAEFLLRLVRPVNVE